MSDTPETAADHTTASSCPATKRRSILAAIISVLLGAVPTVLGGLFCLDPLLRKKDGDTGEGGDADGMVRVGNLSELPKDGTPVGVKVVADKVDAWNKYLNVPIGSVWLRQVAGQVIAFNAVCPHLGCAVEYREQEEPEQNDFYCPCHTSAFDLDGVPKNEVPPRQMDTLEVRSVGDDGEIYVLFQNFRGTTAEKIAI